MPTIPEATIDTLNGLLDGHINSVFEFILSGSPYVSGANAELRQLLEEIHRVCQHEARQLVELIESLGGVPRIRHRVAPEEQYLSFLSLKFLLPTLVNEKDLLLTRYENARTVLGDNDPRVTAVLRQIEAEQCAYIAKLKTAADQVTAGKFQAPAHSQQCEESPK